MTLRTAKLMARLKKTKLMHKHE